MQLIPFYDNTHFENLPVREINCSALLNARPFIQVARGLNSEQPGIIGARPSKMSDAFLTAIEHEYALY